MYACEAPRASRRRGKRGHRGDGSRAKRDDVREGARARRQGKRREDPDEVRAAGDAVEHA